MDEKKDLDLLVRASDLISELQARIKQSDETIKELIEENKELAQSQATWDLVAQNDRWFDFKEAAKLIGIKGFGRNKILDLLRKSQVIDINNQPYQRYVNMGLFKITLKHVEALDAFVQVPLTSKKGIDYIVAMIEEAIK